MAALSSNAVKVAGAVAMLSLAGILTWRFLQQPDAISERAYYYDLSENKLFVAERGLVPPIRGVNDAAEDGMRAVVISRSGKCDDKTSHEIAYLEKYSPDLKQQMEEAKASGHSPAMGRTAAQGKRLVKRVADADWVTLATPEGERIVSEWAVPDEKGVSPAVCTP